MCLAAWTKTAAGEKETMLQKEALTHAETMPEQMDFLIQPRLSPALSSLQSILLRLTSILYHFLQLFVLKKIKLQRSLQNNPVNTHVAFTQIHQLLGI